MPGSHVDVNMHPTKKEVGFLHQENVVDSLRAAVEHQLLASNNEYASPAMRLGSTTKVAVRRMLKHLEKSHGAPSPSPTP